MARKKKKQQTRTFVLNGTDHQLVVSKATAVNLSKNMIHLDQLDDGTWRLIYNSNMIPDFSLIQSIDIIRDEESQIIPSRIED